LGGGALGKAAHLVKSSETGPPPDTVMLKDLVGLLRDTGRTQEAEELVRLLGREPASSANLITTTPPGIGQVDLDNIALRKYNVLLTARYFNYRKARLLLVSMISEVIAIALVAGSIVFLLAHYG
jgi:hypothetical protein